MYLWFLCQHVCHQNVSDVIIFSAPHSPQKIMRHSAHNSTIKVSFAKYYTFRSVHNDDHDSVVTIFEVVRFD